MNIFDLLKNKFKSYDKNETKEDNLQNMQKDLEEILEEEKKEEKLNLDWQNEDCKNRVQCFIEYFFQCISREENNEAILKHINNIFAYQENLKKLFTDGSPRSYGGRTENRDIKNDNNLTIKIFSVLMELLSSENIYRERYEKEQEGLTTLKEILKVICAKKNTPEGKLKCTISDSELQNFVDNIFDISKKSNNYTVKDFFSEYEDLFFLKVTKEQYESSLIDGIDEVRYYKAHENENKNNPIYPFPYYHLVGKPINVFELKLKNRETGEEVQMDYTKMYIEEMFDFLMNYLIYVYKIVYMEPAKYDHRLHYAFSFSTAALYNVYKVFGHQFKPDYSIKEPIIDISISESTDTSSIGESHYGEDYCGRANYVIYAVTENKKYELYNLYCRIYSSFSIKNQGTFDEDALTDYGANLTSSQLFQILELIENQIFNENGNIKILDYESFICCITMFELLNENLKDSKSYFEIKNRIKKLTSKLGTAQIDYLDKKIIPAECETQEDIDKYIVAEKIFDFDFYRAYAYLLNGISDERRYGVCGEESRKMKQILEQKYQVFLSTKESAVEQLKQIQNNLDSLSNLDGEVISKHLDLLRELASVYEKENEEDDNSKKM